MKYIKDVYKEYNPILDNYGIKLYRVYQIGKFRFKIKYHSMRFCYPDDFNRHLNFYVFNGVQHISQLYRD